MKTIKAHPQKFTTVGLGGGCHWCTEAVYSSLIGIVSVEQGWIASTAPDNELSEAVLVTIDEQKISLQDVIEIHLYTHSSTSDHSMRKKYRSAVYAMSEIEKNRVQALIDALQKEFTEKLVTKSLLFVAFKKSDEEYLDYFYKNPDKPFCQTYIQPKLKKIMQRHSHIIDIEKIAKK